MEYDCANDQKTYLRILIFIYFRPHRKAQGVNVLETLEMGIGWTYKADDTKGVAGGFLSPGLFSLAFKNIFLAL